MDSSLLVRCKVRVILWVNLDERMNCNVVIFQEPTLYLVKGMVIMDNDGNRILAKYFDSSNFPTVKEQKAFEKNLFAKTHRANSEVIMLDGLTCVYKSNVDLFFYVMGSCNDNEVGHSRSLALLISIMFVICV